jgi:hypothetical protein
MARPAEFGRESARRPGAYPGDPQTAAFVASRVPPILLGDALLRSPDPGCTWTDPRDAVAWLRERYEAQPPPRRADGTVPGPGLDDRAAYAVDRLADGSAVVWAYWNASGAAMNHHLVVACPSRTTPQHPCPQPPA